MSHVLRYKVAVDRTPKATDATLKDVTAKEATPTPEEQDECSVRDELEEQTNLLMSACRGKNPIIQENQAENPVTDWNTQSPVTRQE